MSTYAELMLANQDAEHGTVLERSSRTAYERQNPQCGLFDAMTQLDTWKVKHVDKTDGAHLLVVERYRIDSVVGGLDDLTVFVAGAEASLVWSPGKTYSERGTIQEFEMWHSLHFVKGLSDSICDLVEQVTGLDMTGARLAAGVPA